MKHTITPQRYLILLAVMLTASVGDTLLSHGMSQIGPVDFQHLDLLWHALFNPFVASGAVGKNCGVNADQFAPQINESAT